VLSIQQQARQVVLQGSAPLAPSLPATLKCIIHMALHANPDGRYQTGGEMREKMVAWLNGQGKPFGLSEAAVHTKRAHPSSP
jgi:hypothetical protein